MKSVSASTRPAIPELRGRVLVLGLGVTGASCVRSLRRMGVNVAVADTREAPPAAALVRRQYPDLPLFLGRHSLQAGKSADLLLLSPGLGLDHPLVVEMTARSIPVWGDVELFARLARAPVAAITGSNGKSTVTALLAQMAANAGVAVRAGGNLGPPALDLLDDHTSLYVLELSSFQLETTYSLDAEVAAVLNLTPDHQDRYSGLESYAAAKARVYRGRGVQVVNRDDPTVMAMADENRRVVGFGRGQPAGEDVGLEHRAGALWLSTRQGPLLPVADLALRGAHNVGNALAAVAMGQVLGFPATALAETLRTYRGLPHRCQQVAERRGVVYVDDSKGTNVAASVAAIEGFPGPLVLIAGGLGKDQDFTPLGRALSGRCRAVVLIGKDATRIRSALGEAFEVVEADSLQQAVAWAAAAAQPGDTVLLSPACASFDMFSSFEDRGRQFGAAVRGLADGR